MPPSLVSAEYRLDADRRPEKRPPPKGKRANELDKFCKEWHGLKRNGWLLVAQCRESWLALNEDFASS